MSIDLIWPVHLDKLPAPDAYPHLQTVIRCRKRAALCARPLGDTTRFAETGARSFVLVDET